MNPQVTDSGLAVKWLFRLAAVVIIGFCAYIIVAAVHVNQTTGTLHVTSSSPQAILSISQNNSQAKVIGTGSTKVRLQPGSYRLSGSSGSKQATTTVQIYKKRTTSSSLKLTGVAPVPSVYNINFVGMDGLVNSGITTEQISKLEQAFFQFKPTAQTVTINTASISPGPHDPNSNDPTFTMDFSVTVDSASYNATISYADLQNVEMRLYSPVNGAQVFDSYAASPSGAGE